MTAVPHFLDNAEEEDAADLAALTGIDLNAPKSDAQLDALASDVCRQIGNAQRDLARYADAEKAELVRIGMFYEARYTPLQRRIQQLEAIGAEIAKRAQFPGKSKSRKVAFGSYGSRKVAERVSVVDEAQAIHFLLEHARSAVSEVVRFKISLADAKPAVLKHLAETGVVAIGFEHVGESEKFFIKAEI